MITSLSATTRRIALSTFAALALAVALPHAGLAAETETGLWKINPALSKSNPRSSSLVIERAKATDGTAGAFVVISGSDVYLATPATDASTGVKAADYSGWKGMKLTHIGKRVRAINECLSGCQFGEVSDRLKLTFRNVGAAGEQMSSIIAGNQ